MNRIVLASGNAGKLREFQQMLGGADIEFVTQRSLGVSDADETGLSFVENAILKARHASALTGLPALKSTRCAGNRESTRRAMPVSAPRISRTMTNCWPHSPASPSNSAARAINA